MTSPGGKAAARPRRVALTGGIATGKSHCLAVFKRLGASVIDADQLARDVVAPGSEGLDAVVTRFGRSVLLADGQLNRAALGMIVFADPTARQHLEEIIHPRVYKEVERWFGALTAPIGIADIPLLFETSRDGDFDLIVVAACRPDQQLSRLMARTNLSEASARVRIAAQLPLADKVARADFVIDTGGTEDQTASRTEKVWNQLHSIGPSPQPR
jgi:dephospho-CoA kinase